MTEKEDAIIRDRLAVEERTLRRILKRHTLWKGALLVGDIESAQIQYNDFMLDLSSYELYLMRFQLIHDMHVKERQNWIDEKNRIEGEIEIGKDEIIRLRDELKVEQEQLKFKTEYDELARAIQQHTSRQELKEDIKQLDQEIADLEQKVREKDETLSRRRNQIEGILSIVARVQEEIREENSQEERLTVSSQITSTESIISQSHSPMPLPTLSTPALVLNGINGHEDDALIQGTVENEIEDNISLSHQEIPSLPSPMGENQTNINNVDREEGEALIEEGEHEEGENNQTISESEEGQSQEEDRHTAENASVQETISLRESSSSRGNNSPQETVSPHEILSPPENASQTATISPTPSNTVSPIEQANSTVTASPQESGDHGGETVIDVEIEEEEEEFEAPIVAIKRGLEEDEEDDHKSVASSSTARSSKRSRLDEQDDEINRGGDDLGEEEEGAVKMDE
ncbi:400_t:CDS:2 [Ambispora gerdemannii]|uniref:400_t:CDS:1 n=1 Tax=Ambispora gerdemannii TaxID=144530 RepID=A0A9N8Z8K6_9GLOM|nr:400_t:CDS:2 [Ambispora gerdemannii]